MSAAKQNTTHRIQMDARVEAGAEVEFLCKQVEIGRAQREWENFSVEKKVTQQICVICNVIARRRNRSFRSVRSAAIYSTICDIVILFFIIFFVPFIIIIFGSKEEGMLSVISIII